MKDIMLDLETLSLKHNATIISIGAVLFDLHTGEIGESFHISLPILEQAINGADIDTHTLEWWASQDSKAKETLLAISTVSSIEEALVSFNEWIQKNTIDINNIRLWGNGITADNTWIRGLYNRHNIKFILPYWCDTDVRTLVQLENYDKVKKLTGAFQGVKHDAIADCTHQIKMCNIAYKLLKEN